MEEVAVPGSLTLEQRACDFFNNNQLIDLELLSDTPSYVMAQGGSCLATNASGEALVTNCTGASDQRFLASNQTVPGSVLNLKPSNFSSQCLAPRANQPSSVMRFGCDQPVDIRWKALLVDGRGFTALRSEGSRQCAASFVGWPSTSGPVGTASCSIGQSYWEMF